MINRKPEKNWNFIPDDIYAGHEAYQKKKKKTLH